METPSQIAKTGFRLTTAVIGMLLAVLMLLSWTADARAGATLERSWGPYEGNNGSGPVAAEPGPGGAIFTLSQTGQVQRLGGNGTRNVVDAGTWGSDIAVGRDGTIFVLTDAAVMKYSPQGELLATIGGFNKPEKARVGTASAIEIAASGNVLVADPENGVIRRYKPGGRYIGQWGGDGKTRLGYPTDLAIEPDGTVLVVDSDRQVIRRLSADGRNLGIFGSRGWLKDQIYSPAEVATDDQGHVFVADWDLNRIQVFGADGDFIEQWGRGGYGNRNFDWIEGLEASGQGKVVVTDSWGVREFQVDVSPGAKYAGIGAGTLNWNAAAWPGEVARIPTAVFNFGEVTATNVTFCYSARMMGPRLDTAGPRCRKVGAVEPGEIRVLKVRVRIPKRNDPRFDPIGYDFDVIVRSANAGSVLVPSGAWVKSKGKP